MTQSIVMNPVTVTPVLDLFESLAPDLEVVEKILAKTLKSRYSSVAPLVSHVQHFRGKRLRPALLLLVGRATGGITPAHPVLAAVVEMIHTATLVHDDILDSAAIRRHVATVNSRWDSQAAVLMGDYLFTHAFHLASTVNDVRACQIIGKSTNRVCEGELCQVLEKGNLELTESVYFDIIDGKTAELIACCCQLGALFSGASETMVSRMTRFGRNIGLAFQIADDLLDLVGDESHTGKSLGSDLQQLKLTLPLIHLLETGSADLARQARITLLNPVTPESFKEIRNLLKVNGSLEYARKKAEELVKQARSELQYLPPSLDRKLLEIMTDRIVNRNH